MHGLIRYLKKHAILVKREDEKLSVIERRAENGFVLRVSTPIKLHRLFGPGSLAVISD